MKGSQIDSNDKIEAIRKRQAALREQMARELVRRQKKNERDEARLHAIIGEALVANASKHPDFELMLKSILKAVTTFSDSDVKLLRRKGWL